MPTPANSDGRRMIEPDSTSPDRWRSENWATLRASSTDGGGHPDAENDDTDAEPEHAPRDYRRPDERFHLEFEWIRRVEFPRADGAREDSGGDDPELHAVYPVEDPQLTSFDPLPTCLHTD